MHQIQTGQAIAKALQRFPEIVELTEARKRAIAGGRASIAGALKQMTVDAQRPYENRIGPSSSLTQATVNPATRAQQAYIDSARSAAYTARGQALTISQRSLEKIL